MKSISESKKLSLLKTDGARLLYTWLIPHLDINGCFSGDAEVVNGKIFTRLSKSKKTIEEYLIDLQGCNLIIRYERNGDQFLYVPDFKDKQPSLREDREAQPTIPLPTPDEIQSSSGVTPISPEQVKISKDKISKDKVKVKYKECVFLTEEEHKKLIDKYGEEKTEKAIDSLNNYKMSKGKKYKSDYHAILRWVIDSLEKKDGKWEPL